MRTRFPAKCGTFPEINRLQKGSIMSDQDFILVDEEDKEKENNGQDGRSKRSRNRKLFLPTAAGKTAAGPIRKMTTDMKRSVLSVIVRRV